MLSPQQMALAVCVGLIGGVSSGMLLPLVRGRISRGATVVGCTLFSCAGVALLGLSLLFADGKVLMVQTGTQVKVLDLQGDGSSCEVRILAGEHTAKTAIVPRKYLS